MTFKPRDLQEHQRLTAPDAPAGWEVYSRDALAARVPEAVRDEYMAAADAWVEENGGYRFKGWHYIIPRERSPFRRDA